MSKRMMEAAFVSELSARAKFSESSAKVYEIGTQSVVVLTNAGTVYKAFASSRVQCGKEASAREATILEHVGGYSGDFVKTPELKSHIIFDEPFQWGGKIFNGAVEQTFMPGDKPYVPVATQEVGAALAEFHHLLSERQQDIPLAFENIPASRYQIVEEGQFISTKMPAQYAQLARRVDEVLTKNLRPVHGDFLDDNMRGSDKMAVVGFARTGLSVPEQDMIMHAALKPVLRGIMQSYADVSGYKPSERYVMTLVALNLAVLAEREFKRGDMYSAGRYGQQLRYALEG